MAQLLVISTQTPNLHLVTYHLIRMKRTLVILNSEEKVS
jgi:hypothetical protein